MATDTKTDDPDRINDIENPELTEADFARSRPFAEVFPEQFASWKRGRGRPKVETPKVHVGFRMAADVVDGIKATGKGFNSRVERVLRDALASGQLDMPAPDRDLLNAPGQEPKR